MMSRRQPPNSAAEGHLLHSAWLRRDHVMTAAVLDMIFREQDETVPELEMVAVSPEQSKYSISNVASFAATIAPRFR